MPNTSVRRMNFISMRSGSSLRRSLPPASPASDAGSADASKVAIGARTLFPARIVSRISVGVCPADEIAPVPVMMARAMSAAGGDQRLGLARMAEHDATVRAAEAERVRQRGADASMPRRVAHEVQVRAIRVDLGEVGVDRHRAVADRE